MAEPLDWNQERAAAIIADRAATAGACLPILHEFQRVFGYIADEAIPMVAEALNLSRAEIYGIVTFYHDFRRHPPGRHILHLCRAEACQSMGGVALSGHARARFAVDWHETSADGRITLQPAYCLGLCATAPAALLDGFPLGRLTAAKLDAALEAAP